MNEEQMKQLIASLSKTIDDKLAAAEEKRKKDAEEADKKAKEDAKKKAEEDDALKAAEKKVLETKTAKNAEELEKERMMNAFKFNSTLKEFIKNNKDFLPDNLEDILNILEAKTYQTDVEKAQELKRAIVEQYIKKQENMDMLPDSLKSKAEKFASFTTKQKLESAPDFYDIVETGIHTAKNIKKVEAIEKSGGLGSGEKTAIQDYEEKMVEFSKEAVKPAEEGK